MRMTFRSETFFPFLVPEKDESFAENVGARTLYPAGFTLSQILQIYWRTKTFHLVAAGDGAREGMTQALRIDQALPPRNVVVGTNRYELFDDFHLTGPGDMVVGRGVRQTVPGTGTVEIVGDESGINEAANLNLQVNLFYPAIFVPDPVIRFDGLWWPAMSVACATGNLVELDSGGELDVLFDGTSLPDPASETEIGTFSFFGVPVPIFCTALESGETRTFSGELTVEEEWE